MTDQLMKSHTEYTKKLIKKAFIELFSRNGLEKLTVRQICETCHISRSTFYQYFDDKYAVLEAIENHILNNLKALNQNMKSFAPSSQADTMPNFIETIHYIGENREYILPLISIPGDPQFLHRWKALMQEDFTRRLKTDNAYPQENGEIIIYAQTSAIVGMYEQWLSQELPVSAEKLAEIGTQLLWSSFYRH